ncbi:hypothetical protein FCL47_20105 [Desulfopila sp. IMCC35006]|uniref:glycosyltransferase family 39 protein n=1 Tax=Desulfopila sp. IMCC35006 TaxID=2569542 RepID=UPI0010AB71FE|nr:glycosyltransferase family 39 protein [Desulfopila sp. IMCC35006]TKB23974.1 hypothetical protein FCL47_20105 [Desulfopila sp. IMCC35006]
MPPKISIRHLTIIGVFLISQLLLTLYLSFTLNIWVDEYFSLYATSGTFSKAIHQSIHFDFQPPLYYLLLTLWRHINNSIFFARLLSVVCVAIGTFIFYRLSCRLWNRNKVLFLFPVVAFNPYLIWAACEIRLYALLLLECALLMLTFYEGFLNDSRQTHKSFRLFFFCCSLTALYTQYYAGFFLLAAGFTLLVLRRWREMWIFASGMLVVGVLFLPMVGSLLSQLGDVNHTAATAAVSREIVASTKHIDWMLQGLLIPDIGSKFWANIKNWYTWVMIIYLVFLVVRHRSRIITLPNIYIASLIAILSGSFILISYRLGLFYTQQRHLAILVFPLLGVWLALFCSAKQKWIAWSFLYVSLAAYCNFYIYNYIPPVKNGDWERVAKYVMKSGYHDAPVLIFRNEGALPFSTYYQPAANIIPIPNATSLDRFDVRTSIIKSDKILVNIIEKIGNSSKPFWLLTYATGAWLGTDIGSHIVEQFVKNQCKTLEEKQFVGTKVRLLQYISLRTGEDR